MPYPSKLSACLVSEITRRWDAAIPGPLAAARASSPMKKSRSSVPLLAESDPPDPPPVKYDGLLATAGLPEPLPPAPPGPPLVAIAVGKTKDGASFPANPGLR